MTAPTLPEQHAAPPRSPDPAEEAPPAQPTEPPAGSEAGGAEGTGDVGAGGVGAEARMRLLAGRMWVARNRPYYARALFACPIVFTDETASLSINGHWRIRANPRFAASRTVEEVAAMLIHEINHLLRDHHSRSLRAGVPDEGFALWKIAADFEINDDLRHDGLQLPEGVLYPEDFGLGPGRLAEQYYRDLIDQAEHPDDRPDQVCGHDHSLPDDGSGDGPSMARREQMRREAARDIAAHQHAHGDMSVPEGLGRWAASHAEPKADWRRLLAAELRKGVRRRPGTGEADWARPPRRPDHGPVLRPGTARPAADIAVVVDTSASMRPDDHSQALAEIRAILRAAVPGEAVRVHSADERAITAQNITRTQQIRLAGGGGTDMGQAVIDANAARPRPTVIIVITDGGTHWPPDRPPNVTAAVIAVLTRPDYAQYVPRWIAAVHAYDPGQ